MTVRNSAGDSAPGASAAPEASAASPALIPAAIYDSNAVGRVPIFSPNSLRE